MQDASDNLTPAEAFPVGEVYNFMLVALNPNKGISLVSLNLKNVPVLKY